MFVIPPDFVQRVNEFRGAYGQAWIERLPTILADCERRWDLMPLPPFPYASVHYVAPALRASTIPVVLKVHAPTSEFVQEATALRLYAGRGMVTLLEYDMDQAALLLERLQPGTTLRTLSNDVKVLAHAVTVMRQLRQPAPPDHPFPSVADWARGLVRLRQQFNGGTGPFRESLVERAEALYRELSASSGEEVILHGDLHHDNILAAERQPWLAIDPKGVVGEPAYETGAILRNFPLSTIPQPARFLARCIDQLSSGLDLDRQRICDWAFYQAVLSAWWTYEDAGKFAAETLYCAELLASL